jgi:hypothetical protein
MQISHTVFGGSDKVTERVGTHYLAGNHACEKRQGHSSVAVARFQDDPAPEVWTHKIFSTLMEGRAKIEAVAAIAAPATPLEKKKQANAKALLAVLDDINLAHLLHQDGGF